METKLTNIKNNNRVKKTICTLRSVAGEAVIAGLAIAYVSEHIRQVPHQAATVVAVLVVGLVLYFAKSNQVK